MTAPAARRRTGPCPRAASLALLLLCAPSGSCKAKPPDRSPPAASSTLPIEAVEAAPPWITDDSAADPGAPFEVIAREEHFFHFRVDGTLASWTSGDGIVTRLRLPDGRPERLRACGDPGSQFVLDDAFVYCLERQPCAGCELRSTLVKLPLAGGPKRVLARLNTPAYAEFSALLVDEERIYLGFREYQGVIVLRKDDGAVVRMPAGRDVLDHTPVWDLRLDSRHLYWVFGDTVQHARKDDPSQTWTGGRRGYAIAAHEGTWFWTDAGPPDTGGRGSIQAEPSADGGSPKPLAEQQCCVRRMAADDAYVYWTNNRRALRRVPRAGGPTETLLRHHEAHEIAAAAGYVYWLQPGPLIELCRLSRDWHPR